jgi:triosephosphate isomerase (TIM)
VSGPGRRPLVAGNWKMNKTGPEATAYCERLLDLLGAAEPAAEVAICPPFTAIERVARALEGSPVWVAAQTVYEADAGAHTGEVSAPLVAAAGARGTIVGHSERRAAGETDAQVAARLGAALRGGLVAIVCVGESLEQREGGVTTAVLERQVRAALAAMGRDLTPRVCIAYEPIWAIGTGLTATPEVAQEACAQVRALAGERLDGAAVRVLYGGSVTPANAAGLMREPDIDGALVGGASLDPDAFWAIVAAAAP